MNIILPKFDDTCESTDCKRLHGMLDTLKCITDMLKDKALDNITSETAKAYALITGNQYLITKIADRSNEIAVEFRPSIDAFLFNRIHVMISDVISHIHADDMFSDVNENSEHYELYQLRTLEMEVSNNYDMIQHYDPKGTDDQDLASSQLKDLTTVLHKCISTYTTHGYRTVRFITKSGTKSIETLALIGYLISMTALTISKMYRGYNADDTRDANLLERSVIKEFTHIANKGSHTLETILCCYQSEQVLPLVTCNTHGELGVYEKKLLVNQLVLNKLLYVEE
jgi:hypothetical protein